MKQLEDRVLSPLKGTDWRYTAWMALLVATVLAMLYFMYDHGVGPKYGAGDPALWGVYNDSLVFFVGLALGGVLVSGFVRLGSYKWGPWVTRLAEITVFGGLLVGLVSVIAETGDLKLLVDTIFYGQVTNPLVWNGAVLAIYLVIACGILYFAMVPDMKVASLWVRRLQWLYRILSFGYSDTEGQKADVRRIALVVGVIAAFAVLLVHTALTWTLDGIEPQPDHNVAMAGPYFISAGLLAAFALATAVAAMLTARLRLRGPLGDGHIKGLSRALLILIIIHLIISAITIQLAEYTVDGATVSLAGELWTGEYMYLTWTLLIIGLILPAILVARPGGRNPKALLAASAMVFGVLWLRAYLVVVPGLSGHTMPIDGGVYEPSLSEWGIALGMLALFAGVLTVIYKLAPMVSMWEMGPVPSPAKAGVRGWGRGTPLYRMMYYVWMPTILALLSGVAAWIILSALENPVTNPDGLGDFPSPLFVIILVTILVLVISFVAAFFQTRGWVLFVTILLLIVAWLAIELLDWLVGTWGSRMILLGVAAVLGLVVGLVLFMLFIKRSQTGIYVVAVLIAIYAALMYASIELDAPDMFLGVFLFNVMIFLTLVGYKILIIIYTMYKKYTLGA